MVVYRAGRQTSSMCPGGLETYPTAPLGLITVAALLCPSGRYVIDRKTLTDSDLAGAEHLKASAF
jgi:hypothetical protein